MCFWFHFYHMYFYSEYVLIEFLKFLNHLFVVGLELFQCSLYLIYLSLMFRCTISIITMLWSISIWQSRIGSWSKLIAFVSWYRIVSGSVVIRCNIWSVLGTVFRSIIRMIPITVIWRISLNVIWRVSWSIIWKVLVLIKWIWSYSFKWSKNFYLIWLLSNYSNTGYSGCLISTISFLWITLWISSVKRSSAKAVFYSDCGLLLL